jgi:hypothetical protein
LLPRLKLLGLGGVRKLEAFQGVGGAREPRFRFVQCPDNVLAGYVGNSVHTHWTFQASYWIPLNDEACSILLSEPFPTI